LAKGSEGDPRAPAAGVINDLRADLQRVTEHANHYSERVGQLTVALEDKSADLRACAEALADTLVPLEALHVTVGWELSPLIMGEIARVLGIGRAVLARPGVQAERKK